MDASYHRHDINDKVWEMLEPHLPGQRGRTGAPWRDLPPDYGKWGSVHQRFIRWRKKGVWEKLLEILIDEPDYEWLMIDAVISKCIPTQRERKAAIRIYPRQKGA